MADHPFEAKPGARVRWTGEGFEILGHALRAKSEQGPIDRAVTEHLT
jgi:hypothetical protein